MHTGPDVVTPAPAATDSVVACIAGIQDVLDRWRTLGRRRLGNGTELIGRAPVDDAEAWLHVLHAPVEAGRLDRLETQLRRPLPSDLRALYRCLGGLSLFAGAFVLCGPAATYACTGDAALQPASLLSLNHELQTLPWMHEGLFAFAFHAWDQSVHVYDQGAGTDAVLRLDRQHGVVRERHANVWACLLDRLTRLDRLLLR